MAFELTRVPELDEPEVFETKHKKKKTDPATTKWEAFDEAQLAPSTIVCDGYLPIHPYNGGCHSRVLLTADAVISHMAPDHGSGGGFKFLLKKYERKISFWSNLKARGVELHDLRCDVCDKDLPLVPRRILKHMEAHSGRTAKAKPGGTFWMTLRFDEPEGFDVDEF